MISDYDISVDRMAAITLDASPNACQFDQTTTV